MRGFCFLLLVALASADVAPIIRVKEPIAGKFIIGLKPNIDIDATDKLLKNSVFKGNLKATLSKKFRGAFNGFAVDLDYNTLEKIRRLDFVDYIEEDGIVNITGVLSWGLDRIDQKELPMDNKFEITGDGAGVSVYVIDTGINPTHNEFGGRAAVAYDATGGDGIDCKGHGTHCAGVIAGNTYGIAKSADIYGVKVFPDCTGSTYTSTIIDGINYVYINGRKPGVVSLSLGGNGRDCCFDDALKNLIDEGFVVVVAAGNYVANACLCSPGRVREAITVGATDSYDNRLYISNFGSCVDIFAPGSSIKSAWWKNDSSYRRMSGTSVSCPLVSGVAAILLSRGVPASQVRQKIFDLSTKGVVRDPQGSHNRLLYID